MTSTAAHDDLARWARQVLQRPIRPDKAWLDVLEATLGTRDPTILLIEGDSSESASILELLFYPDQQVRLDFERRWGERTFSTEQADVLVDGLLKEAMTASLQMDDVPHTLAISVPDFAVAAFIARLKITWQAPDGLLPILHAILPPQELVEVRSRLRQARIDWHAGHIHLIERFLTRIPMTSEDFPPCWDFLLSILDELRPKEPPFEFLAARKLFFFQSLCQNEAFEQRRLNSNMEILILQGARAAHGDLRQWQTGMRLVDRICTALYGHTRFFQRPGRAKLDEFIKSESAAENSDGAVR
jgi:hypothetical protein